MANDSDRPNILLIMTDQQRWDTLGTYGNPVIRTPNLDRLAAEGILFETAITPSPVCAPTRAALMSGYAPSKIHFTSNGHYLEDQEDTLPTMLNEVGYLTQGLGKMHFPEKGKGCRRPWEVTYGFQNLVLSEETRWVRQARSLEDVAFDDYDQYLLDLGLWGWDIPASIGYNRIAPIVSPLPEEYGVTAWLGNLTVDWLRHHAKQPFFLFTGFVEPHMPYSVPEDWANLYDPYAVPPPVRAPEELHRDNPWYEEERRRRGWELYSEKAELLSRAYYYASVSLVDKYVGQILTALEELGLREDTYIIFTSDHGDLLGDHWMWLKRHSYDGCVRVPLIMAGPDIPQGVRIDDCVVSILDVFGTILARAGAPIPSDRPSRDLLDYLRKDRPAPLEFVVSEVGKHGRRCRSIRTNDWLYVHWENGGYEELYDLRRDPQQLHDVAKVGANGSICRELRTTMTGWLQEWGDAGWELDREGKLLEHEFEARDVGHFVPRPDGATPRDFLSSSKLWTKKPDYWFWRWPAVNGDYSRLPGLTRRIYGENYRRAGSME